MIKEEISSMEWDKYLEKFDEVLNGKNTDAPYNKQTYIDYVKLNHARLNRWLKKPVLTAETKEVLANIKEPQKWILIAEPWCGDAAHSAPMIHLMANSAKNIDLEVQLRDEGSMIDKYLTNGGKSIPKLIVRNSEGKDLFTWGPRPEACQSMVMEMKATEVPADEKNKRIQSWYNKDKGTSIQNEFIRLLSN